MSELSAFAAYKKNVLKKKNGARKPNGKAQPKKTTAAAAKKKGKAGAAATQKKTTAVGKVGNDAGIKSAEIDQLVEQLLGNSPSKQKKLSKAEQQKKQDLEDYLVRQLERDDNGEYDSEDDDDDYSSGSDDFSDEYTLNSSSYTDYTDKTSGNDSSLLNVSYTGESTLSVGSGEEFSLSAFKASKATAKRKSTAAKAEAATNSSKGQKAKHIENTNGATKPKKAKKTEEAKKTEVVKKPVEPKKDKQTAVKNGRQSLPASVKATNKPQVSRQSTPATNGGSVPHTTTSNKPIKQEPPSPPSNVIKMNSISEGEKLFKWLIAPVNDFFTKYWEQNACLVQRQKSNYFSHLISFEAIGQMLLKNHIEFTKNIDITSYKNGVRETLNPEGRALPPTVWDHYSQGCSIRLLNPQTYLPALFSLNTTLQEYFHCMVGANAYLTPPNSQGFAPHYDDIEAFVLQIEGRKRWKLYKPRNQSEMLPRYSSPNFNPKEIGKPILEQVLQPGDLLYFPRGTIHQACTEPGYHSLHITLSVYQKQSYADLFERLIPLMLQHTIANNIDMRRGLPLHTWRNAGIAFNEADSAERADLLHTVSQLLTKSLKNLPLAKMMDAAVDQVAKKFQHEALPPDIHPAERTRTIFGSQSRTNERGEWACDYELELRTNVRLLRANVLRLVEEEQKIRIYYYLDNSKEYCEYEPNFIEIEPNEAASVEVLIKSYPQYVGVSELPLPDDDRKIELATALWERGLLMMEKPFK